MNKVRVKINIYLSILTSLTSLTSILTSRVRRDFSLWYISSQIFSTLPPMFFRGKRGKEVRVNFLLSVFLLPLKQLLPLSGGKRI
jgi:hypothetical protein